MPSRAARSILLLGEKDSGKEEWLNSFQKYLSCKDFSQASKMPSESLWFIPNKFSMWKNDDEINANDVRTYVFQTFDSDIYIVDAPEIGDTNLDGNIVSEILTVTQAFQNFDCICLCFKSRNFEISSTFRYSMTKFFTKFGEISKIPKIAVLFTDSKDSGYKPGEVLHSVGGFFEDLEKKNGTNIKLTETNIFCVDNEVGEEKNVDHLAKSWKHSASETHRFLKFVAADSD